MTIAQVKYITFTTYAIPLRVLICTFKPHSAAVLANAMYDPQGTHEILVPAPADIAVAATEGKQLVMVGNQGEDAKLNGQPCNAVVLVYTPPPPPPEPEEPTP